MSGDWMPMRLDLERDPAIIAMAVSTGEHPLRVIGACWKVWAWFAEQSSDGRAAVTLTYLDRHADTPKIVGEMLRVGWLRDNGDGTISVPRFARWVGKSAKDRLKAARRQRAKRERDRRRRHGDITPTVTVTSRLTGQDRTGHELQHLSVPPAVAVPVSGHGSNGKAPKSIRPTDPEAAEIAAGMVRLIHAWDPQTSPTRLRRVESPASIEAIRRLIQVDQRPAQDVRDVLVWLFGGGPGDYQGTEKFDWRTVIQGGQSLRKSWDQLRRQFRFAMTGD